MTEDNKYSILFILLGIVTLFVGLIGPRPTYGGGWVRKYASIVGGLLSILYGIVSLFSC
jgi:putative Mn2+ efflux pump MntP